MINEPIMIAGYIGVFPLGILIRSAFLSWRRYQRGDKDGSLSIWTVGFSLAVGWLACSIITVTMYFTGQIGV